MKKKVLLISGSPRGKKSNSRRIALEFLEGMNRESSYEIEEIICQQKKIEPCRGCFFCWGNEEGECVIQDDMKQCLKTYIEADFVVWSFPNYYFGMAAKAKIFMERLLPVLTPYVEEIGGNLTGHGYRYSLEHQKYLLFCTSGLYNLEQNIDAIDLQFRILYGDKCEKIFCPEGQIFMNRFLERQTQKYFATLQEAGYFYHRYGYLDQRWREELKKPILGKKEFLNLVNAQWIVRTKKMSEGEFQREKARVFVRSMALTYEPGTIHMDPSVLEIEIVDCRYHCQLILGRERCKVVEEEEKFEEFCLKIVVNMDFFEKGISFRKDQKEKCGKQDFDMIVQLLNRCEGKRQRRTFKMI
ncbi:MAG: flavodoxin family protein [Lachnospiraceae bacterium]|nr:flavodoxin family protein [Robinsoniella sp.]MDY3767843.1 flavodoxin family protein [Lachnospiraceae bacterium]